MHPLDRFTDLETYKILFTDVAFWEPYVRQVCAAHAVACRQVSGCTPGSFPVFIVDRLIVIKFFGPLFGGNHCYAVELEADRLLRGCPTIPAARVLFAGRLAPPGANWDWPYLGFEYLEGQTIGAVYKRVSRADRVSLANQLGRWVRALHALELPDGSIFESHWDHFEDFIQAQRTNCRSRQAAWDTLPPHLVAQIDDFIPSVSALVDRTVRPHWIHADLTGDHLLGNLQGGHWTSRGLIDFGDARTGTLYYELAALHLDLLQGDRRLLASFLDGVGFQPPRDFSRLALSYCLLHEFNMFTRLSPPFPPTLEDLARQLWEV